MPHLLQLLHLLGSLGCLPGFFGLFVFTGLATAGFGALGGFLGLEASGLRGLGLEVFGVAILIGDLGNSRYLELKVADTQIASTWHWGCAVRSSG